MISHNSFQHKVAGPMSPGTLDRLVIPAIIALVAVGAFGLGRLSAHEERAALTAQVSIGGNGTAENCIGL